MADASTFDKIRIGISSPDQIRDWSYGEVKKPETINYRTFKPERDGLFCEKIFGPTKDWECHCGRYKKVKFKGVICDRCGVEVTRSKVRRERMGHIELASPVCHIWYLKGVPSPLALILDMTPRPLEKVLYFASYIVTAIDKGRIAAGAEQFRQAVEQEVVALEDERDEAIAEWRDDNAREIKLGRIVEVDIDLADEAELAEVEEEIEEAEPLREPYSEEEIADKQRQLEDRVKQEEKDIEERAAELRASLDALPKLEKRQLITEDDWRAVERLVDVLVRRVDESLFDIVEAGLGGAAIQKLLAEVDLESLQRQLKKEIEETQGTKRLRAIKRIEVVNAFIESKSRPEWMILNAVPVISPELRPMVQLDGGRFATSDLNDLYRRIINRNNRLKKIQEIRAPESIVNHEKRLLQEAVDALIDNGRRTRPVTGSNGRALKSLSDMLKGKEGRFRKNLLGKRVDYSGRSVIVVGPDLHLHECGLPKEMALELFKPFVMKTLVERGFTSNIKTAKRMIERMRPEVWDALEEVIKEHPVLLNRAPTLHRLGIQAFEPKLVDGKAIQLHPLVCKAFNADFDGDQMAVHIPLSASAQAEARILMLSTHNLFSPADGSPIVSPQQDIVLGAFFLTMDKWIDGAPDSDLTEHLGRVIISDVKNRETGEVVLASGRILTEEAAKAVNKAPESFASLKLGSRYIFASPEDAEQAYEAGHLDLHEYISVRLTPGKPLQAITVGRIIFNEIIPDEVRWVNESITKKSINNLVASVYDNCGSQRTIQLLDELKALGFKWATRAGITFSMTDMQSPESRARILRETEEAVNKANVQFRRGVMSPIERKQKVLTLWTDATAKIGDEIVKNIDRFNPISIITTSGARGSIRQISQLSGMRGLMADPFGNIIEDLPVKSNFHEGLSVLEYFVTTHGARKGLADTALRTADAGYLTRRLVDVAQDVIIREIDCETEAGIYVAEIREGNDVTEQLWERIKGRTSLEDIVHPETGEIIVAKNEIFTDEASIAVDKAGVKRVGLRSVLTCESRQGVCATCYGRDMALGRRVEIGVAVGIIAAQSIGEPGTQLTMRTFHTGGVATANSLTGVASIRRERNRNLEQLFADHEQGRIALGSNEEVSERERSAQVKQLLKVAEEQVGGLLRVVELFEARKPKGQAIVTEYAGKVAAITEEGMRRVVIHTPIKVNADAKGLSGQHVAEDIKHPETGDTLFAAGETISTDARARKIRDAGLEHIVVQKEITVPYRGELKVKAGMVVEAGDRLTDGPLDPQKVLELQGLRGLQEYLIREVQRVYKQQGVDISDKHIEVIVRQMLKKRKIVEPGDTLYLHGQLSDRFDLEDANRQLEARDTPGKPATSIPVLLGITEASLATESFLSAASFQKTTRVLTEAAVRGKRDQLVGLKENVIIGRLIPAGTGLAQYRALEVISSDGKAVSVLEVPDMPDLDDILAPLHGTSPTAATIDEAKNMLGGDLADGEGGDD
ncbi:MAG: DNA-directed RNA polymerase subunit beta' [Armatimonas sp.]